MDNVLECFGEIGRLQFERQRNGGAEHVTPAPRSLLLYAPRRRWESNSFMNRYEQSIDPIEHEWNQQWQLQRLDICPRSSTQKLLQSEVKPAAASRRHAVLRTSAEQFPASARLRNSDSPRFSQRSHLEQSIWNCFSFTKPSTTSHLRSATSRADSTWPNVDGCSLVAWVASVGGIWSKTHLEQEQSFAQMQNMNKNNIWQHHNHPSRILTFNG